MEGASGGPTAGRAEGLSSQNGVRAHTTLRFQAAVTSGDSQRGFRRAESRPSGLCPSWSARAVSLRALWALQAEWGGLGSPALSPADPAASEPGQRVVSHEDTLLSAPRPRPVT